MNTLDFKEGQTYICTKSDKRWWKVGKEYKVVLDDVNEAVLLDDENSHWSSTELATHNLKFKLKEEQPKVMMKELKEKDVEHKYTPCDVNKIIIKAYQTYNNDAQRLAFIKGYFAK
ncbi:TPA: hypothetical protein ACOBSY_002968 [Enterococcus faecium]|jgi:regulation of enolase protein 1 (concanavalin A-like superfamily)|uniref:hypothetical protein n=1 Tax=Enterococcus faecium TaxID=1352 RepID=UPI0001CEB528|nr:hypothetical protein [Enterococcus faecium]EFF25849.1 hypothetical protein EfmE1679_2092 [Enterococcus faecium E1679]MCU7637334.1 hypothetical protein [Enterococcus faecium]MDQ8418327.1 hypothetical protein [Enterococcus faecium]OSP79226.1 hypothetical protein EFM1CSP_11370 [Enterococcus faecium]TNX03588.1 hypothetical protein FIU54_12555 [Enterococcus faecium]